VRLGPSFFTDNFAPLPDAYLSEDGSSILYVVEEYLCWASLSLATLALFQGDDGFLDSSESYIYLLFDVFPKLI